MPYIAQKTAHKQHQLLFPVPMGVAFMLPTTVPMGVAFMLPTTVALELWLSKCMLLVKKALQLHSLNVSQYCGRAHTHTHTHTHIYMFRLSCLWCLCVSIINRTLTLTTRYLRCVCDLLMYVYKPGGRALR